MDFNFGAILLGITAAGIALNAFGIVTMQWFRYLRKAPPLDRSGKLPGVTVVKTCYRADDNEEENFKSLFRQDYPGPLQVLFVVSAETDPIVPLIKRVIQENPDYDLELIVSTTRKAFWKKVDALYDSYKKVKHEVVIWSDSDTVVHDDYLSQMVASLQEDGVCLVTTPQYDFGANNFATAFKVLANNCDVAVFMTIMDFFSKNESIAFGQSIGFWKAEVDAMGEDVWTTMNTFLADDQAIPYMLAQRGKKVVFRYIYCPVIYADKTLKDVFRQKIRWLVPQKMAVGNTFVYSLGVLFYPICVGFVALFVNGFSQLSIILFLAACGIRILISLLFEIQYIGKVRMTPKYFWVLPLWDLAQLAFYPIGTFKRHMRFEGKTFRVVNRYFLEEKAQ